MYATTQLVMAEYGTPITWDDYRRHFTPDWRLLYRRFRLPEDAIELIGDRWWALYRGHAEAVLLPAQRTRSVASPVRGSRSGLSGMRPTRPTWATRPTTCGWPLPRGLVASGSGRTSRRTWSCATRAGR